MLKKSAIQILTVALGAVLLGGCHDTVFVISKDDKTIALYVKKGDTIRWVGLLPTFIGDLPCKQDPKVTGVCKIKNSIGFYHYRCHGCPDPEVVIGSDLPGFKDQPPFDNAFESEPAVGLYCKSGNIAIDSGEKEAYTLTVKASPVQVLSWHASSTTGNPFVDWEVKFTAPDVCYESSIKGGQDPPTHTCTMKAPQTVTTYQYTATGKCGASTSSASGNIVVKQQ